MFECVLNISEGRDVVVLDALERAAGSSLRDRHSDAVHHRSVFTLINEPRELVRDVRQLITLSFEHLDLSRHAGVHPRFGVVDVVPFVALVPEQRRDACVLRDETARWIVRDFAVPVFLYGPRDNSTERTLPQVRREAFVTLAPDDGPLVASPALGAVAVGCRDVLVAWNLWLSGVTFEQARELAAAVRQTFVRALAFRVGDEVQVSCNLLKIDEVRTSAVYDRVQSLLPLGGAIEHAELVGLAPRALLEAEEPSRWEQLGLTVRATIEARID